jgi:cobalt-zinc-cadmium efflux system membrane fusion protein
MAGRRAFVAKFVAVVLGLIALGIGGVVLHRYAGKAAEHQHEAIVEHPQTSTVELVPGYANRIKIHERLIDALRIRFARAEQAPPAQPLRLLGSLVLDPTHYVRIHSLFSGQIVSVGAIDGPTGKQSPRNRPLRFGDVVKKGDVLATIWSKEVGEKKSELVNAICTLAYAKANVDRLQGLPKGVVAEKDVRSANHDYQSAVNARATAERTLASWHISDDDLAAIRDESDRVLGDHLSHHTALDRRWAEAKITAPFNGTILESNVTTGDTVDTSLDLFKIADLSRLGIQAQIYEDDLPSLLAIPATHRDWTVFFPASPQIRPLKGRFELPGNIIDPSQHTATVNGWVNNRAGQLKIGQFLTAEIALPQNAGEIAIPTSAIIDHGAYGTVLVACDPSRSSFSRRKVAIVRGGVDQSVIRSNPSTEEAKDGIEPLHAGEWVIASGLIELEAEFENLEASRIASANNGEQPAGP